MEYNIFHLACDVFLDYIAHRGEHGDAAVDHLDGLQHLLAVFVIAAEALT